MTMKLKLCQRASTLMLAACSTAAMTQIAWGAEPDSIELAPIHVENGQGTDTPNAASVDPSGGTAGPYSDVADLLRTTPGVSTGRMGGHGLEIVIRGQQKNQISIIVQARSPMAPVPTGWTRRPVRRPPTGLTGSLFSVAMPRSPMVPAQPAARLFWSAMRRICIPGSG